MKLNESWRKKYISGIACKESNDLHYLEGTVKESRYKEQTILRRINHISLQRPLSTLHRSPF